MLKISGIFVKKLIVKYELPVTFGLWPLGKVLWPHTTWRSGVLCNSQIQLKKNSAKIILLSSFPSLIKVSICY